MNDWISSLISAVLGGSLIGGIVALLKLKPEGDQIVVSSAKDVVLIQAGALDRLRTEMSEMERRFTQQEQRNLEALKACERREAELRTRVEALEAKSN